jgi:hypothetical protein
MFWPSIPDAMTLQANHIAICLQWMLTPTYLFLVHNQLIPYLVFLRGMGMQCHWLVADLASALFLTNGNDKAYHAFMHLEELEMLPTENLTMYLPIGAMVNSEASLPRVSSSNFIRNTKTFPGPSDSRK